MTSNTNTEDQEWAGLEHHEDAEDSSDEDEIAEPLLGNSLATAQLYIGDLHPTVTEQNLMDMFARYGNIVSLRVCRNRNTQQSRCFGYVNFMNVTDANVAKEQLNFEFVYGRSIRVMWSCPDPTIRKSGIGNIIIKNLDDSCDNRALYNLCLKFGNIRSSKVVTDDDGAPKGYGFVHFENVQDADRAVEELHATFQFGGSEPLFVEHVWQLDNCIFVKNLPFNLPQEKILGIFGKFGTIKHFRFKKFKRSIDGKETDILQACFCYFSKDPVVHACRELNGGLCEGNKLTVQPFRRRNAEQSQAPRVVPAVPVVPVAPVPMAPAPQPQAFNFDPPTQNTSSSDLKNNLYVKNLAPECTDENLRSMFAPFGQITSVRLAPCDVSVTRPRTTRVGYVSYATAEEATNAIRGLNGIMDFGIPLYVTHHMKRQARATHLSNSFQHQLNLRNQVGGAGVGAGDGPAVAKFQPGPGPAIPQIPSGLVGTPRNNISSQPLTLEGALANLCSTPMSARPATAQLPVRREVANTATVREVGRQLEGVVARATLSPPEPFVESYFGRRPDFDGPRSYEPPHRRQMAPTGNRNMSTGYGIESFTMKDTARNNFVRALAAAGPQQQKSMLFDRLLPLVQAKCPQFASQITNNIVELDPSEILHILEDNDALTSKVNEILRSLAARAAAAKAK